MEKYKDISPYTDEQAREAFARIARHPMLPVASMFLFPNQPLNTFNKLIKDIKTVDEFQAVVMERLVSACIDRSSSGFTVSGIEHLNPEKRFLAVSNHRDIILDPALVQWTLLREGIPFTEICVGSNLLQGQLVSDLLRSNRMIKVIRGISAREMYLSSKLLSSYIRDAVSSGRSSVWIAQREGRAKNGLDLTEQGLLKMFDMSGSGDFQSNFEALNIVPMSISYEYESCDIRKARELLIARSQKYVKKRNEDTHSIITGIRQWKGGMHLHIDEPLTAEEIAQAAGCDKNLRYQALRGILDRRIIKGYHLWKTNYMGYDLMTGTNKYADMYSESDLAAFKAYTERKLNKVERRLDRAALRQIFWEIYGNPVLAKEKINEA